MAKPIGVQERHGPSAVADCPVLRASPARQACLVRGFLSASLACIDDIRGVFAEADDGQVRVTVLVGDFWGEARPRIHQAIADLRKRLNVPDVDILVLPAGAVGDDFGKGPECEQWA